MRTMRTLIIGIGIVVVGATIGTILVGNSTFDGVVVERPYEAGLAWEETQKAQARLGWKVVIERPFVTQGEREIVVRLSDRSGSPLGNAIVDVTLSRPSTNVHDRTYRMTPLGGGRYRALLMIPLAGLWDLRMAITRGNDAFAAIERIEAAEQPR